mmetsp:Transcript_13327/g.40311  ORF Transcript_13327/g.40311 Transcript_13327/m.40311 type:complete len:352 (-) Transcript_13327:758-1813(-)|eukprot:CAMPEP_0206138482 /NCGR_PEP_ID=MMETSP1473-20131121/3354_1 /ASSEMBLY_ACC=CAM_ASM_001109 /TAXON_ID=1461547 /ORGANISM="Stichococcus sp, Strain RCC1054" /LENGTH=351 /DNA_ID=CAMNT_0053531929 /DNA_START=115 /DNA_END=1170 /DNA_ORIENTATION=+
MLFARHLAQPFSRLDQIGGRLASPSLCTALRPLERNLTPPVCQSRCSAYRPGTSTGAACRQHGVPARQQHAVVARAAGDAALTPEPAEEPQPLTASVREQNRVSPRTVVLLLAVAAAAVYLHREGYLAWAKDYFYKTQLGKSGFPAAFSLIFLSEIGDKTFFIAALLAAKFGRWLSFSASVLSLSVMTLVSVGIGLTFARVPDFMKTSLPIGEWAGAALLVYFGLRTLRDAWQTPDEGEGDELVSAQQSVDSAETSGRMSGKTPWQAFVQVATLIFVAEWGDRSMLATIVLAVSQSPVGVAGGAIAGHALATFIAVLGGAFVSQYVSEKTISYIGGFLFLLFAALTLLGVF